MTTHPAPAPAEIPPLTGEQQNLVESCVGLARKVARDLHRRGGIYSRAAVEDLEAEAYHGLCVAASRFEPARGFRFTTFATWYARGYCQNAVFKAGVVTLPGGTLKEGKRKRSQATRAASAAAVHARRIAGDSRDDDAPGHRPACRRPGPAEEAERRDFIRHTLSRLHGRERRVIEARVLEGRRLEEVGAEMKLSRERVRQIETRALAKLRRVAGGRPA